MGYKLSTGVEVEIPSNLSFLLHRLPIQKPLTVFWMGVPEFSSKVLDMISMHKHVSTEDVLAIMEEVYALKRREAEEGVDTGFDFKFAYSACKALKKKVGVKT